MERTFSPWIKWDEREKPLPENDQGVYLIAHFDQVPKGSADPFEEKVVYIGESTNSFWKRWRQFQKSAFADVETFGHSGGRTYMKERKKHPDWKREGLYLAYCSFPPGELGALETKYWERKLILDYAIKHKCAPPCNKE